MKAFDLFLAVVFRASMIVFFCWLVRCAYEIGQFWLAATCVGLLFAVLSLAWEES